MKLSATSHNKKSEKGEVVKTSIPQQSTFPDVVSESICGLLRIYSPQPGCSHWSYGEIADSNANVDSEDDFIPSLKCSE